MWQREVLSVVVMVAAADFMCGYTAVNNSGLFLVFFGTTRSMGWNLPGETAAVIVFVMWGTAEMGDLVRSALPACVFFRRCAVGSAFMFLPGLPV